MVQLESILCVRQICSPWNSGLTKLFQTNKHQKVFYEERAVVGKILPHRNSNSNFCSVFFLNQNAATTKYRGFCTI